MKNKLIIISLFAVILISSCKKEEETPQSVRVPSLDIKFGYFPQNNFTFIPFPDQNSVSPDVIDANNLAVSFIEKNSSYDSSFRLDSLIFEFDVKTKNDLEHFNNRENIYFSSTYSYSKPIEIGGEFPISYNFGNSAVKGNGTVEFGNTGDYAVVTYKSRYSALMGRDSIVIKPK